MPDDEEIEGRKQVARLAAKEKAKAEHSKREVELHQQAVEKLIESSTDPEQARKIYEQHFEQREPPDIWAPAHRPGLERQINTSRLERFGNSLVAHKLLSRTKLTELLQTGGLQCRLIQHF